jgi:hypothetical protein
MKISRLLLLIGMVLYVVSFFLTAVKDAHASPGASGYPGYLCAYLALVLPWVRDGMRILQSDPLNYFGILLSGWINLVFLITVVLLLGKRRLGAILTIVLLFMFVACWIVFYKGHLRPQIGYFLWTTAMLLAVFSAKLGSTSARKELLTSEPISPSLRS